MRYILDPLITETETCHCFNPILKIVGCSVKAQQLRAKYHQNHLIYPSKKGRLNSLSPTIYVHIIYIYYHVSLHFLLSHDILWYHHINWLYIYICIYNVYVSKARGSPFYHRNFIWLSDGLVPLRTDGAQLEIVWEQIHRLKKSHMKCCVCMNANIH